MRLYLPGPDVCFSLHVECVRGSDCTPVAHSFRNVRSTLAAKGKVNSCRITMEASTWPASGRKRSFGDRSVCGWAEARGMRFWIRGQQPIPSAVLFRTENIFHENVSSWMRNGEERGFWRATEERQVGEESQFHFLSISIYERKVENCRSASLLSAGEEFRSGGGRGRRENGSRSGEAKKRGIFREEKRKKGKKENPLPAVEKRREGEISFFVKDSLTRSFPRFLPRGIISFVTRGFTNLGQRRPSLSPPLLSLLRSHGLDYATTLFPPFFSSLLFYFFFFSFPFFSPLFFSPFLSLSRNFSPHASSFCPG